LQGFYFWEAWGGACGIPQQQNKEVAALSLRVERIGAVLPGRQALPSSASPAVRAGTGEMRGELLRENLALLLSLGRVYWDISV